MFYSEAILSSKGPLAKVWLAAHMEKKLSKHQLLQTDLKTSIMAIKGDDQPPMALRLSGQLLLGVVRIYSRKAKYLLEDCNEANLKIKMAFRPGVVDLPADQLFANFGSITLPDTVSEFAILIPDPEFSLKNWEHESRAISNQTLSRPQDITIRDNVFANGSTSILRQAGYEDFMMPDDEPELRFDFDDMGFGGLAEDNANRPIEVGRDAALTESPVIVNMPGMDKSITPKIGDIRGVSFGGSEVPLQGFGGSNASDLGLPGLSGLHQTSQFPIMSVPGFDGIDLTIPFSSKRLASQARKRKLLIDSVLEISQHDLNQQLKDTSDITTRDTETYSSKRPLLSMDSAQENLGLFMDLNGPSDLIPELQSMFSRVNLGSTFAREDSLLRAPHAPEEQLREFAPEDFAAPDDINNAFSNVPSQFEDSVLGDIPEASMFYGNDFFEDDASVMEAPFAASGLQQVKLAKSSLRAVELIKNNIQQRAEASRQTLRDTFAKFEEIAEKGSIASRSDAVKMFFELLVLKTKDIIDVKQTESYGDIEIVGKEKLFDANALSSLTS